MKTATATHIARVKSWKEDKGFGFLFNPTPGDADIFVHHTGILGTGRKSLHVGDEVQFHVERTDKGLRAINVVTRCRPVLPSAAD